MSSPAASSDGSLKLRGAPLKQLASHAKLLRNVSTAPVPTRRGRPDAIIVPAGRPASALTGLIELAANLGTLIVVLCSQQAKLDQVVERIRRVRDARGLVVQIPEGYALPDLELTTLSDKFAPVSAGRAGDLSVKRNFGLLLARLSGWNKIIFIDDDVTVTIPAVSRMVHQLDNHQIVGMRCTDFPDNSVVCHARRLGALPQDVFVTGAVLGVNCGDLPLPFFPHIYNEDWFFFGEAAAQRDLACAGSARQMPYKPFASILRAEHEEFGDLLAEGLYWLVENQGGGEKFMKTASEADERFWDGFIAARLAALDEARKALASLVEHDGNDHELSNALASLDAAGTRHKNKSITPESCVAFIEEWRRDAEVWRRTCLRTNAARTVAGALASLNSGDWLTVR